MIARALASSIIVLLCITATAAAAGIGWVDGVTDEHSAGECEFQDDRTILVLRITDEPVAGDDWSKIPVIY